MRKFLMLCTGAMAATLGTLANAASAIDVTAAETQIGEDKIVLIGLAVVAGIALISLKWAKRVRSAG